MDDSSPTTAAFLRRAAGRRGPSSPSLIIPLGLHRSRAVALPRHGASGAVLGSGGRWWPSSSRRSRPRFLLSSRRSRALPVVLRARGGGLLVAARRRLSLAGSSSTMIGGWMFRRVLLAAGAGPDWSSGRPAVVRLLQLRDREAAAPASRERRPGRRESQAQRQELA